MSNVRRRRRGSGTRAPIVGLLPLAILIVALQLFAPTKAPYLVRPSEWIAGLRDLWQTGSLGGAIGNTAYMWLAALAIAVVVGTLLGTLVGRVRVADRAVGPFFEFCRVLPAAAVVPLVVVLAGYTTDMQLEIVVFGAVWPILLAVRAAAVQIPEQLFDTAASLRLSRFATLRKIIMPSIYPGLLVGIRIAAPIVLILVLLVEILTQVGGIGAQMVDAQQNFLPGELYGLVCVAGVMGLIASWGVSVLSRWAERARLG